MREKGKWLKSIACPDPKKIGCTSSDAFSIYQHADRVSGYCWSCEGSVWSVDKMPTVEKKDYFVKTTVFDVNTYPDAVQPHRLIRESTSVRYGIKMSIHPQTGTANTIYYPWYIKSMLAGYKARELPKHWLPAIGSLQGVDLFRTDLLHGGKKLFIVEGEEDVLATYQMIKDFLVSKGNTTEPQVTTCVDGVKGFEKAITNNIKLLEKYSEILFIPDNDRPGQAAVIKLFNLLPIGKLRVVQLSEKDPSDMLVKGKSQEFLSSIYEAQPYKPTAIKTLRDTYKSLSENQRPRTAPYPITWKGLNYLTKGKRADELGIFIAGTGVGKSTFFKEMIHADYVNTTDNIGILSLEESIDTFSSRLFSIESGVRLNNCDGNPYIDHEDKIAKMRDSDRFFLLDHRGGLDDQDLWAKLNYMVFVNNCKWLYIDHLHMLVSEETSIRDENARIDMTIRKLNKLALKGNIWIGLAAHLRKTSGDYSNPFECGGKPTIDDLKGASSAKQEASLVVGIQGNTSHTNPEFRHIRQLHVLKSRWDGSECGPADYLSFNTESGRLNKIKKPEGFKFLEKEDEPSF